MAFDPETIDQEAWRKCEKAVSRWLRNQGLQVTNYCEGQGDDIVSREGPPLIRVHDRNVAAPDFKTLDGRGVTEYWEVKHRTRLVDGRYPGRREVWMPLRSYLDYRALSIEKSNTVWIVLHEGPLTGPDSRWMKADISLIGRIGSKESRSGNGHEIEEFWVWPASAMQILDGPPEVEDLATTAHTETAGEPSGPHQEPESASNQATTHPAVLGPDQHLKAICGQLGLDTPPRYSVLRVGPLSEDQLRGLLALLPFGLRVFIVTPKTTEIERKLQESHAHYADARLLEWAHCNDALSCTAWAIDGKILTKNISPYDDPSLSALLRNAQAAGGVNADQYHAVHADSDKHVMVRAGAGTGKTETMSERLIFLLATACEPIALRDVAFVTFTREAARQMRDRLGRTMAWRRRLCERSTLPVTEWLMHVGAMQVSTIHALARQLLREHGAALGLRPDITVSSRKQARTLAIRRALARDNALPAEMANHVGYPKDWADKVDAVWKALEQKGVDIAPIGSGSPDPCNWAAPGSSEHAGKRVADVIQDAVLAAGAEFAVGCGEQASIPTDQLVSTAHRALIASNRTESMRVLFVDEFQDTDMKQIDMLCELVKKSQCRMFVVGDVKQGVYRFRGATGDAFTALEDRLGSGHAVTTRSLTINFRSGAKLLESLEPYFRTWGAQGLLDYKGERDRLIADPTRGLASKPIRKQPVNADDDAWLQEALQEVNAWKAETENRDSSMAILCRENWMAEKVRTYLVEREIPCELGARGEFWRTDVVKDVRSFLQAALQHGETAALLELCETPWAAAILASDKKLLEAEQWSPVARPGILSWTERLAGLNLKNEPPDDDLAELRCRVRQLAEMLDNMDALSWLAECRKILRPECVEMGKGELGLMLRRRYDRGLNHLQILLDETFADSPVSLPALLDWIVLQMATNRKDDEPLPSKADKTLIALTVHRAKGLEYDRVLIPYTWASYEKDPDFRVACVLPRDGQPQLLWRWRFTRHDPRTRKDVEVEWHNGAQTDLWGQEAEGQRAEEARLLYVAMTRARSEVVVFVPKGGNRNKGWHLFLQGVMA